MKIVSLLRVATDVEAVRASTDNHGSARMRHA